MNLSLDILKRRLLRATWLPLFIMSAFFLGSVGFVLQKQHRSQLEGIKFSLSDLVGSQINGIAQEVYLNQEPAFDLRIGSIIKDWVQKHPEIQVCVRMELLFGPSEGKTFGNCSHGAEPKSVIESGVSETREVSIGEKKLALIRFSLLRPTSFLDIFPPLILGTLVLALLVSFLSYKLLIRRVQESVLTPLLEKLSQDERDAAIASTTRMLAHDIRKPFSVIRLALTQLTDSRIKEVKLLGETIQGDVNQGLMSVDSMLQDILDVSRNMKPELGVIELRGLIDEALNSVTRIYPSKQLTVTCDLKHEHAVLADRGQVVRVLTNLIENAFQAMDEKGELEIGTSEVSSMGKALIEVSVRNNGPIIPEGEQGRIFEPFVTGRKNGTGLGLAIAKRILEAHGGELNCVSNEKVGTVFSFTLPSSLERSSDGSIFEVVEIGQVAGNFSLETSKERVVLVFDDEALVHSSWSEFSKGHSYLTFAHFRSWEDFVSQDAFSLVEGAVAFVDVRYKGSKQDGFGIAKALRHLGVKKVFAITSDPELARESSLFDGVFGKEIPKNFSHLVA